MVFSTWKFLGVSNSKYLVHPECIYPICIAYKFARRSYNNHESIRDPLLQLQITQKKMRILVFLLWIRWIDLFFVGLFWTFSNSSSLFENFMIFRKIASNSALYVMLFVLSAEIACEMYGSGSTAANVTTAPNNPILNFLYSTVICVYTAHEWISQLCVSFSADELIANRWRFPCLGIEMLPVLFFFLLFLGRNTRARYVYF